MNGGCKHRATQRNKASQPAKNAAQGGVVADALAHASGEAGRGPARTATAHVGSTWDEANRDAARTVALGFVQVSSRQSVE